MRGKWQIPEYPSPSVYKLPASQPRCAQSQGGPSCRVCNKVSRQKERVHPVDCYRLWDDSLSSIAEAGHLQTPWQMVAPFLAEHGYTLATPQNTKKLIPSSSRIADDLDNPELSHTYPAWDKFSHPVYIKMVPLFNPKSHEFQVLARLDRPTLRDDPRNHSVSVRDVLFFCPDFTAAGFTPQRSDRRAFVVTERFDRLAGPQQDPGAPLISLIRNMKDYIDFVTQVVEGAAFLHGEEMAHRNLNERCFQAQWTGCGHHWLIADFAVSAHFPMPRVVQPSVIPAGELKPPEVLSQPDRPYDSLAGDVWNLGSILENLTRTLCLSDDPQWLFPEELRKLLSEMTASDPKARPTSGAVQQRVVTIFSSSGQSALSSFLSYVRGNVAPDSYLLAGATVGLLATRYFRYR